MLCLHMYATAWCHLFCSLRVFILFFLYKIQFFVLIRLIIYVHTVFSSCEGRFFCLLFKKNPLPFSPRESEKTVAENQACQFCLPNSVWTPCLRLPLLTVTSVSYKSCLSVRWSMTAGDHQIICTISTIPSWSTSLIHRCVVACCHFRAVVSCEIL